MSAEAVYSYDALESAAWACANSRDGDERAFGKHLTEVRVVLRALEASWTHKGDEALALAATEAVTAFVRMPNVRASLLRADARAALTALDAVRATLAEAVL